MIKDAQYIGFMQRLVMDQRGNNSLNLSEWEASFVQTFARQRQSTWFTEGRRAAADRMWRKLGPELNFPHPLDEVARASRTCVATNGQDARATVDGCEYLVRLPEEGGRQNRCNAPAVKVERRMNGSKGMRYCADHALHVEQRVKGIKLVPIQQEKTELEQPSNQGTKI